MPSTYYSWLNGTDSERASLCTTRTTQITKEFEISFCALLGNGTKEMRLERVVVG